MKGKLQNILKDKENIKKEEKKDLNTNNDNKDSCSKKVNTMTKNHKKDNESLINKMTSEFEKIGQEFKILNLHSDKN